MAGFRKPRPDQLAPPGGGGGGGGGGTATALAEPPAPTGGAAEECMAAGQALVQAGRLDAERLADALLGANGDLLKFGAALLDHYGIGRNELARAVAAACGVPVADSGIDTLDEEIVTRFPEEVARKHKVMPIADEGGLVVLYAADPSPPRRQAVEQATGQRFVWKASDDRTVTSFIEQMYRSTADVDLLVSAFANEDEQRVAADAIAEVSLDDRAPVVQLVAASSARPCATGALTSTSSRSTTACASASASTATSSRASACRCRRTTR